MLQSSHSSFISLIQEFFFVKAGKVAFLLSPAYFFFVDFTVLFFNVLPAPGKKISREVGTLCPPLPD